MDRVVLGVHAELALMKSRSAASARAQGKPKHRLAQKGRGAL